LAHDVNLVDLQQKPEAFTNLYREACADTEARAKVPLLEVTQETGAPPLLLVESLAICEFLQEECVTGGAQVTSAERYGARLWATLFSNWFSYIPILKAAPGSDEEAQAIDQLKAGMRAADAYLRQVPRAGEGGPFLLGKAFSLAEVATAPFVMRFAKVLPGLRPSIQPNELMAQEGLTRLSEWLDAVCARPSCTATIPDDETLTQNYSKMLERMKATAA
jgi:glutathione S-transferase